MSLDYLPALLMALVAVGYAVKIVRCDRDFP